ncbi:MAG: ABC transporter ATP-binding protein/permease [Ruminococcaceae bacterium]|nr:ABC transporter ATP-binding protein/permease [Oscillospiraceae bacterium]
MLETRNLCKVYKPKRGVPVRALDDVSLKLPERGMVFLLGKSGSGKSTLLNLLGGLDRYDEGDIIIRGVSSKNFKQQDFDTYRNTYVGFIFQEYNVLEEFSVGANIALAIELQGRRATDEEVNKILLEVDLEGYGNRKPNELSGGQKQRVAIARALIKNPEIIMADEPTGALDSVTGRAVLDTLKKLSADKLVLVVSHDREFAETYGDRIIELADGKVISDMEYTSEEAPSEQESADGLRFGENTVEIPLTYRLSEEDRLAINRYLEELASGDVSLRPVAQDTRKKSGRVARPTDTSSIKTEDGSTFRRIKSKLPLRNAFKIGAGALKHKKFRLAVTIFLSCVAFILFGLADTFGAYNHIRTCSKSLVDSGITYASLDKKVLVGDDYYRYTKLSDVDIATLREHTGLAFHGVLDFYSEYGYGGSFYDHYDATVEDLKQTSYVNLFASTFTGMTEMDEAGLAELGYDLVAGRLPDGSKDEIAISTYVLETFLRGGYRQVNEDGSSGDTYEPITKAEDMIGKTLLLNGVTYTVTGVYDSGLDLSRYIDLHTTDMDTLDAADMILFQARYYEFSSARDYSYASVALVGRGYIARYRADQMKNGIVMREYGDFSLYKEQDFYYYASCERVLSMSFVSDYDIIWLDGEKQTLGEKEVLISSNLLPAFFPDGAVVTDPESLREYVARLKSEGRAEDLNLQTVWWTDYEDHILEDGWRIVGVVDNTTQDVRVQDSFFVSDALYQQAYAKRGDEIYQFAVAPMPEDQSDIRRLVEYCYAEDADVRYPMNNPVTFELDTMDELLEVVSEVFLYVGIFFALFASLMLANFIGTSVAYKKQEIGILRAIGSRSNDVFRIFFSEAFVIAMINFTLSAIGTGVVTALINRAVRSEVGLLITMLNFGIRQIALLLLISLAVAAIASYLPVRRIAAKRPIDAIRNR